MVEDFRRRAPFAKTSAPRLSASARASQGFCLKTWHVLVVLALGVQLYVFGGKSKCAFIPGKGEISSDKAAVVSALSFHSLQTPARTDRQLIVDEGKSINTITGNDKNVHPFLQSEPLARGLKAADAHGSEGAHDELHHADGSDSTAHTTDPAHQQSETATVDASAASPCRLETVGGRASDGYGAWTLCGNLLRPSGGIVYSFGIGGDISFDNAMVEKGFQVYGFDPTVKPEKVETMFQEHHQKEQPPSFSFQQLGLGAGDGVVTFLQARNRRIKSMTALSNEALNTKGYEDRGFQGAVLRLRTLMCMNEHTWLDVLKMDVEGVEMGVCLSKEFREKEIPARQLLIEFHERMIKDGQKQKAECMQLLKEKGFTQVHVSPNKQEIAFAHLQPSLLRTGTP